MAKECGALLTAYQEGKMDKATFIKTAITFGVHQRPRQFYWAKWSVAQYGYEQAKRTQDQAIIGKAVASVTYWKSQLDAWDYWAQQCQQHGVPVRVHDERLEMTHAE